MQPDQSLHGGIIGYKYPTQTGAYTTSNTAPAHTRVWPQETKSYTPHIYWCKAHFIVTLGQSLLNDLETILQW